VTAICRTQADSPRPSGDAGPHRHWPAASFYWSVLDAPACRDRGQLPAGLRSGLEADLPIPVETAHAVVAPMGDGRVVVCAVPRARLESLDASVLSLIPTTIPESIAADLDPAVFNLLIGEFEPRPLSRARARRHLVGAASLVLCAALISLGLLRRANHVQELTRVTSAAAKATLDSTGGDALHLMGELERLRRASRLTSRTPPDAPDAAAALASLLSGWPARVPSKPMSIQVGGQGALVEVAVEGDPTPFLGALKLPDGWTLREPRLNTAGGLTRLSLTMRPETSP